MVPEGHYKIPLSKARIVRQGTDVTLVAWGQQVWTLTDAANTLQVPPNPPFYPNKSLQEQDDVSCEIIDLRTLLPWDLSTVQASVKKTGKLPVRRHAFRRRNLLDRRLSVVVDEMTSTKCVGALLLEASPDNAIGHLVVSHEAPVTSGFGAEIVSKVTDTCFYYLEKPPTRVCGMDTHFPLVFESLYLPTSARVVHAVRTLLAS